MPSESFDDLFNEYLKDPETACDVRESMAGMRIGVQLSEARSAAGMSLDVLARKSGVAKTTILRIERGRSNPSIATVDRLANALGRRAEFRLV